MKRDNIEFLWAWLDAVRRRDIEALTAALDPDVVWQGIRDELSCHGPEELVEMFISGYEASRGIDSLELLGGEKHVVLGARGAELDEINGIEVGGAIYNVFTIEDGRITRIEDYLRRPDAMAAAGIASPD